MATNPSKKPAAMCCVTIGYDDYLLPADKGMRLVDLMQHAVRCDRQYAEGKIWIIDADQPEISMTIVKPSQVRPAVKKDDRPSPFLLGNDQ